MQNLIGVVELSTGVALVGAVVLARIQRLHQAAWYRGQIRDRLRQRIIGRGGGAEASRVMRYAAAPIPGSHRARAAVAVLEIGRAGRGLAAHAHGFSGVVRRRYAL